MRFFLLLALSVVSSVATSWNGNANKDKRKAARQPAIIREPAGRQLVGPSAVVERVGDMGVADIGYVPLPQDRVWGYTGSHVDGASLESDTGADGEPVVGSEKVAQAKAVPDRAAGASQATDSTGEGAQASDDTGATYGTGGSGDIAKPALAEGPSDVQQLDREPNARELAAAQQTSVASLGIPASQAATSSAQANAGRSAIYGTSSSAVAVSASLHAVARPGESGHT